ncbi:MAG: hypothetical protein ACR2OU_12170, partial [Thermomicrobiales bacterium]
FVGVNLVSAAASSSRVEQPHRTLRRNSATQPSGLILEQAILLQIRLGALRIGDNAIFVFAR